MQPLTVGLIITDQATLAEVRQNLTSLPVRVVLEQPEIGDWEAFLDKLNRLRPDVVMVEVGGILDTLAETLRRIRGAAPSPAVVALHISSDPDAILLAMRGGAVEFLSPPFSPSLGAALERISSERAAPEIAGPTRGRTLAFFSAKGGCGATTIACHTAVELARLTKKRVLLADFDLDNGLVEFVMKTKPRYSVLDAITNLHRLDLSFWKALVTNGRPGLEVITAPTATAERHTTDDERLRHILHFVRGWYDFAVAELGRGLNSAMVRILEEADESFLVTTLDVPALYRAKHIVKTLQGTASGGRLRLVLNKVSKRTEITTDEIQELVGVPVFAALPDDFAALQEAYTEGSLLPPGTALARHVSSMTAKISGIAEEKRTKRFSLLG